MTALALALAACSNTGSTDPLSPQGAGTSSADTSNELVALSFLDATHGFGVAEPQTSGGLALPLRLVRTTDAGSTWHAAGLLPGRQTAAGAVRLLFTDSQTGFFRLGGGLFVTYDGGRRWSRVALGGRVVSVAGSTGRVWAVYSTCPSDPAGVVTTSACGAGVEVSDDGGHTWQVAPGVPASPYETGELAVTSTRAADVGLWRGTSAVTYPGGALLATTDGGATWSSTPLPCPSGYQLGGQLSGVPGSPVLWLACLGQGSGGAQGKVLFRSTDGGATWSGASSAGVGPPTGVASGAPASTLEDLHAISADQALVLTVNDGLVRTDDAGASWHAVVPSIAGYEGALSFADHRHGWVAAYVTTANPGSGLWKTTDGGGAWAVVGG